MSHHPADAAGAGTGGAARRSSAQMAILEKQQAMALATIEAYNNAAAHNNPAVASGEHLDAVFSVQRAGQYAGRALLRSSDGPNPSRGGRSGGERARARAAAAPPAATEARAVAEARLERVTTKLGDAEQRAERAQQEAGAASASLAAMAAKIANLEQQLRATMVAPGDAGLPPVGGGTTGTGLQQSRGASAGRRDAGAAAAPASFAAVAATVPWLVAPTAAATAGAPPAPPPPSPASLPRAPSAVGTGGRAGGGGGGAARVAAPLPQRQQRPPPVAAAAAAQQQQQQQQQQLSQAPRAVHDSDGCAWPGSASDADGDDDCCAVCLDAPAAVELSPCGHAATCAACADALPRPRLCPLCRTPVDGVWPRVGAGRWWTVG